MTKQRGRIDPCSLFFRCRLAVDMPARVSRTCTAGASTGFWVVILKSWRFVDGNHYLLRVFDSDAHHCRVLF